MNADGLYEAIFKISSSLEVPVVVLASWSLAWVLYECGEFLVESYRRRRRNFSALSEAAGAARASLDSGDRSAAIQLLEPVAWSPAMAACYPHIVEAAGKSGAETRIRKELADFDFDRQRRLGRTRLLVRVGPALGLYGHAYPLGSRTRWTSQRRHRRTNEQSSDRLQHHCARSTGRSAGVRAFAVT